MVKPFVRHTIKGVLWYQGKTGARERIWFFGRQTLIAHSTFLPFSLSIQERTTPSCILTCMSVSSSRWSKSGGRIGERKEHSFRSVSYNWEIMRNCSPTLGRSWRICSQHDSFESDINSFSLAPRTLRPFAGTRPWTWATCLTKSCHNRS